MLPGHWAETRMPGGMRILGHLLDQVLAPAEHSRVINAFSEHSFSWLNRFRRLTARYERRADIQIALTSLGCSIICCRAEQDGVNKEIE